MAAYAAVVSLTYIINQIKEQPHPPISFEETQIESLTKNLSFFQEFLERHSPRVGYSKEADPLEMRLADAAYSAEDVIETHIINQIHVGTLNRGKRISSSRLYEHLQKVVDDMDSIKNEVMKIGVQDQLRRNLPITPPVSSRSASMEVEQNPTMVGLNDIVSEVMDKLIGGQPDRLIIPIVGMGGIGKTTLAKHIYKNRIVVGNFEILAWVTITQDFSTTEILSQLLQEGSIEVDEYELRNKLHRRLKGRRYLIIMDDIWDIKVWEQLRMFFPEDYNGSRVVLTTRISNFELADPNYVIKMVFLDKDNSWSLFSTVVFGEESCPLELEEIGKEIVEYCRGLPLSIVVVGGLLAKSEKRREYWEYVVGNLNSIVNSEDDEHCLKLLHMSYNHLPVHLKPCFLYMGVFLQDKKIHVLKLVRFWVAEGFLKPIRGKCLEEVGNVYLKELIGRNLVLVLELGCIGNLKYCNVHDLLRDLCLREAQKERFYIVIRQPYLNAPEYTNNQRRVVIPYRTSQEILDSLQSMSLARSLICDASIVIPFLSFRLLRIMSYSLFHYTYVIRDLVQLVNSRYLMLNFHPNATFHSSICLLWNLQTIIIETGNKVIAPVEIWNMPQLRHLVCRYGIHLPHPPICNTSRRGDIVLNNLQTLGRILNLKCSDEVVKRIPNVKRLKLHFRENSEEGCLISLGNLHALESFQCVLGGVNDIPHNLTFPHSIKKLTVSLNTNRAIHSEEMLAVIGTLPRLEKLKFRFGMFKGGTWETMEGQFQRLKFLKIEDCPGLERWTTESSHFPQLEHLVLVLLEELEEIPSEIGEITTLKSVKLVECTNSAAMSVKRIQEEQEEMFGEVELHVEVQISDYDQIQQLQSLFCSNFRLA